MNQIKQKIIEILNQNGIQLLFDDEKNEAIIDIDSINSLSFIATIVDLENEFNIVFPNDLLNYKVFMNIKTVEKTVVQLINMKGNKKDEKDD